MPRLKCTSLQFLSHLSYYNQRRVSLEHVVEPQPERSLESAINAGFMTPRFVYLVGGACVDRWAIEVLRFDRYGGQFTMCGRAPHRLWSLLPLSY